VGRRVGREEVGGRVGVDGATEEVGHGRSRGVVAVGRAAGEAARRRRGPSGGAGARRRPRCRVTPARTDPVHPAAALAGGNARARFLVTFRTLG
jgi:hypothetical protein